MATIFEGYRRHPFWNSDEMIALTTRNIKSPHIEVPAIYRQFFVSHHRPHNIMTQPSPPRVHIPHPCGARTIISLFDSSQQTPKNISKRRRPTTTPPRTTWPIPMPKPFNPEAESSCRWDNILGCHRRRSHRPAKFPLWLDDSSGYVLPMLALSLYKTNNAELASVAITPLYCRLMRR